MDSRTPEDWIFEHADADSERTALAFVDGTVTYGQLADQVHERARALRREYPDAGTIVGVPVHLDLPSIVEVFAHRAAGLAPIPFTRPVEIPHGWRPGASLVVATSGTGGRRRLVPLTDANIDAAVRASRARLGTGPEDRWLLCLPIDHIGGLSVLFRSFEAGGTAILAPFDDRIIAIIRRTRPTVASFVPTMLHRLVNSAAEEVATIRLPLVGGGRLPTRVAQRADEAGVNVVATYGSTETSSQVATMRPGERLPHQGYVGAPLDGFEVSIADPDSSGVGTIVVAGPAVFGGYLDEPRRTGPHRTSDIGSIADDGSLTIVGRSDDVVVSGGVNVSLDEVADTIGQITGVDDVAVVAVDDDEWGSAVCALVASGSSERDIAERIDAAISGPSKPRHVQVVEALPLLPNGKHDVERVRRAFAER